MRLTFRDGGKLKLRSLNNEEKMVAEKLGQLEDIEEELGFDLLTLFGEETQVFFIEWENGKEVILKTDTFTINPKTKNIVAFVEDRKPVILTPNLYKKNYCCRGWAFDRKELER